MSNIGNKVDGKRLKPTSHDYHHGVAMNARSNSQDTPSCAPSEKVYNRQNRRGIFSVRWYLAWLALVLLTVFSSQAQALQYGDRVEAYSHDGRSLNVYAGNSTSTTIKGSVAVGQQGTVAGSPSLNGGYTWYYVNWDNGLTGYSIQNCASPTYTYDCIRLVTTSPPSSSPPTATTGTCQPNSANSALLFGTLNPNGASTNAWFQWGASQSYGNVTASENIGSGTSIVQVTHQIVGLVAGATYQFRLVGQNSAGTTYGLNLSCSMPASSQSPPSATTSPATSVGSTSATLNGSANPLGAPMTVWFEWGTTTSYGNTTASVSYGGTGTSTIPFSQIVTGLGAGTSYHYRTVAQNSAGISRGGDVFFMTASAPPPSLLPAPSLISPPDGAIGVSANPTFSWSSVSGADRYWLMVATNPSDFPTDPNATSCAGCVNTGLSGVTGSTSFTVGNLFPYGGTSRLLAAGTAYYWKVQPYNTNGTKGNYSNVFGFATAAPQTAVATPTFSPVPGTYTGSVTITIESATPGATLRFTTDGTNPTSTSGTIINNGGSITLSSSVTVKAIAYKTGMTDSAIASGNYSIQLATGGTVRTPTFSPQPKTYNYAPQYVTISTKTPNTVIYYTLDGTDPIIPSLSSTPVNATKVYTPGEQIEIRSTTTIKAKAVAPGMTDSAVADGTYTIPAFLCRVGKFRSSNPTVVITHGWQPWTDAYVGCNALSGSSDWTLQMAAAIEARLGQGKVNIFLYRWPEAFTDGSESNVWKAYLATVPNGHNLASLLTKQLGTRYSQPVHLIGHSFGAFVSAHAISDLTIVNGTSPYPFIEGKKTQLTMLDIPMREIAGVVLPGDPIADLEDALEGATGKIYVENFHCTNLLCFGEDIAESRSLDVSSLMPSVTHRNIHSLWYVPTVSASYPAGPTCSGLPIGFQTSSVFLDPSILPSGQVSGFACRAAPCYWGTPANVQCTP